MEKQKDGVLMEKNVIFIKDEYITLSQLLKLTNLFPSGGVIKNYINEEGVYVNDELEFRRGKKLYHNTIVRLKSGETFHVINEDIKQDE